MLQDPGQLAKTLLAQHFDKFGSFRRKVIYKSVPADQQYNPDTGTVVTPPSVDYELYIVLDTLQATTAGAIQIQPDDFDPKDHKVAIFPSLNLPVEPKVGDFVFDIGAGCKYEVVGLPQDPKPAHYELILRAYL